MNQKREKTLDKHKCKDASLAEFGVAKEGGQLLKLTQLEGFTARGSYTIPPTIDKTVIYKLSQVI